MTIKLYSTPTCPWCAKAREYFKKNKIKVTDYDVSENARAQKEMIGKSGQMGVPVIDINGTIIVGYDVAAIEKALKKK